MNILLHSFTFEPNVGGVEIVSRTLAKLWTQLGHSVTVVTETAAKDEIPAAYKVVRNPESSQARALIESHDIVHSNGASLRYFWTARQCGVPFTWTHPAYQTASVDGFGWALDKPAPLEPLASVLHHLRLFGAMRTATGTARLVLRRAVASMVAANVAVSKHQAAYLSLPRQVVIYNPIDADLYPVEDEEVAVREWESAGPTIAYLGRLISEKGVADLIRAFARLCPEDQSAAPRLKIIGDGPQREALQTLASSLGVNDRITWAGQHAGADLRREIRTCGLFILPSAWQEPMGITVVELMASGKPVIVSESGGLSECGGDACRTFPNGNIEALTKVITEVQANPQLQRQMISAGLKQALRFNPLKLASQYLELFAQVTVQPTA